MVMLGKHGAEMTSLEPLLFLIGFSEMPLEVQ